MPATCIHIYIYTYTPTRTHTQACEGFCYFHSDLLLVHKLIFSSSSEMKQNWKRLWFTLHWTMLGILLSSRLWVSLWKHQLKSLYCVIHCMYETGIVYWYRGSPPPLLLMYESMMASVTPRWPMHPVRASCHGTMLWYKLFFHVTKKSNIYQLKNL